MGAQERREVNGRSQSSCSGQDPAKGKSDGNPILKNHAKLSIAFCASEKSSKAPGYPTPEVKDMVCCFNTVEAKVKPEIY